MGKIADIVMGDYPISVKSIFELVDEKYIREENGEKVLEITDELINELALSKTPNQEFLVRDTYSNEGEYLGKFSKYGEIISNHVLARRGYPEVDDVLFEIYNTVYCEYLGFGERENWFNGIRELREMLKSVPRYRIAQILKEDIKCFFEINQERRTLVDEGKLQKAILRLRAEKIGEREFENDELWNDTVCYLREEQKKWQKESEKWKIDVPYYHYKNKIYIDLLKCMELADE